jgi:hypothetical protein
VAEGNLQGSDFRSIGRAILTREDFPVYRKYTRFDLFFFHPPDPLRCLVTSHWSVPFSGTPMSLETEEIGGGTTLLAVTSILLGLVVP